MRDQSLGAYHEAAESIIVTMTSWQARRVANWLNLTTPIGLAIAYAGGAQVTRRPRGVLVASRYRLAFPLAPAFTVGSVVISKHPLEWWADREAMLRHEERHTTQYAVCGGLPFLPLYVAAMAWSTWTTGDRGAVNVFEQWAGLEDGGYTPVTAARAEAWRHRRRVWIRTRLARD